MAPRPPHRATPRIGRRGGVHGVACCAMVCADHAKPGTALALAMVDIDPTASHAAKARRPGARPTDFLQKS